MSKTKFEGSDSCILFKMVKKYISLTDTPRNDGITPFYIYTLPVYKP